MKKPPKTLYGLLTLALNDLKKVERSEKDKVDVTHSHPDNGSKKCHVCLAASLVAESIEITAIPPVELASFCVGWVNALLTINYLRNGDISSAAALHNRSRAKALCLDRSNPRYGTKEWWPAMRKLQADLKKARL